MSTGDLLEPLDLLLLEEEGFTREENGRHLLLLDISSLIFSGRKSIFLDRQADVVKVEGEEKRASLLQELENTYRKTVF
jgi:hypothetical protein